MRVLHQDGSPLVATFEVRAGSAALELVLHSAGGAARAGGVPRNRDYPQALALLLDRLRSMDAQLLDGFVDSTVVAALPLDERRLVLAGRAYPVRLRSEIDIHDLRLALTRAQGPVGRSPQARADRGGNERKRIRLLIDVPGFVAATRDASRLELALAGPPAAGPPAPARGGQGRSSDAAVNRQVELAAMAAATVHFESLGWQVEDVGASRSYDLHCTRGEEVLRVEVKGTTTGGTHVRLTPNEVAHAAAGGPVALFVLSSLVVEAGDDGMRCSGGEPLLLDPWLLDPSKLAPTGYTYSLDA